MGLLGNKKDDSALDDLVPKKSDYVEKIAEKKVKEKEYDDVVMESKMRKFYHEIEQDKKFMEMKTEIDKLRKENEELKEEIRFLKGKSGGMGIGGGQVGR